APWCGPCKSIAPILEELASELGKSVKITKVNVDSNSEIATKYEIRAIPTILVFRNGEIVETIVGLTSKDDLKAKLV
ncbi:MAG TPA: thioredoxin, partial [Opitutae bacterium]|nr:thioredoxin [Opitutae bacterium]